MKLEVTFPNIEIESGKTVLFLNEIQSCPNARVALKSFAMDKRIDVIASGSLLGLYYKEITSYPVGYERIVDMYSLDFEEFLWAIGIKEDLITKVKKSFEDKTHNFPKTLPPVQSELAEQTLKAPYIFDFLTLSKQYKEKDLEDQLVKHITQFLLELGAGFAFVGRQYH